MSPPPQSSPSPGTPRIIVQPLGRLANQMMQLMLALALRDRLAPEVPILGYDLPEWNLRAPPFVARRGARQIDLRSHSFNLDRLAFALKNGLADEVLIRGWGMRLEYYREPAHYDALFRAASTIDYYAASDDEIVLNVRGEDILSGSHPLYFPLPLAYYEKVLHETGLRPVFMGQLEDNFYTASIRERFPDAKFLPSISPMCDFETIRNARHVALSVSSFSWLAAWISSTLQSIHMPICGLYNPLVTPAMLVPFGDPRYRFYGTPFPTMEERATLQVADWLRSEHTVVALPRSAVEELCRKALFAGGK